MAKYKLRDLTVEAEGDAHDVLVTAANWSLLMARNEFDKLFERADPVNASTPGCVNKWADAEPVDHAVDVEQDMPEDDRTVMEQARDLVKR
jgi:hypothetical protein